ncbi:hypothetical protein NDU88_001707 [Pleurodeles waltl]|uniref:Uncharacterized protein n=1 Tax=Pleurodeles waltl TaxID=8319 RepID=A0AAV7LMA8_PLEWA|nr:hypothetical protein NDU88_001707 [Pleurodeles waltl]
MATREGSQGHLEPGTIAHTAAKRKGNGCGKPVPDVPAVVDGVPEEEAVDPLEEDNAALGNLPEPFGCHVEGGLTREEFCKAQKECPTLEGLSRQAAAQAAGEASGDHHIYWENDFLYSEPGYRKLGKIVCWWSLSATGCSNWGWIMTSPWQDIWGKTRPLPCLSPTFIDPECG